ncbi:DEAD/DEAH box helicase [Pseudonocardiaceae bacterium YIM PH 21723]|nr:DEAD/DEAH box helicase [Pseudonocardiaceae bacterium YIM PH 21723]
MSNTTAADEATSFADLDLRPELLQALSALGYEEPTPIQQHSIPALLTGKDVLGQAATGTGKTAAFALPVLHNLPEGDRGRNPVALVLTPTRELAVQVAQAFHRYGKDLGARVLPVYGGQPIGRQLQALNRGVDIVIATPGRAIDHIGRGTLRLSEIKTVVLDEADEMLDMGFAEEIEQILTEVPSDRQTVLFSATMPHRVDGLVKRHLTDPIRIEIARKPVSDQDQPKVRQSAFMVSRPHKAAALGRVLDVEAPTAAIVFCRTREEVDELTEAMNGRGYRAEALHGGMSQEHRDRVMNRLRAATVDLLIATDVAARGLDIDQLTHVINYNVPSAPEAYVHRVGRVGRAGREGVAITLVEPREHRQLKNIERVTKQKINVDRLPTIADLRARRLDLTRASLEEMLLGGGLDEFRVVVETLADEYDVMDVALAAVKLAHEVSGPVADEEEIPAARPPREREGGGAVRDSSGPRKPRPTTVGMGKIYLGVGRSVGIRPQDLVGAITGESPLRGKDIGAIEITDKFSLVEVPEGSVEDVMNALRRTEIRGRKPVVRRDRGGSSTGAGFGGAERRRPPKKR